MKNMKTKNLLLLISVAVLLLGAVGVTVAYLTTQTPPIENTFTPAKVGVEVSDHFETVDGKKVKKDVTITNTEDVDAYVRVAVVANWCDSNGNIIAHGEDTNGNAVTPWNDYTGIQNAAGSNWTYQGGYFYYNGVVDGNDGVTFFAEYEAPNAPVGAHLEMDIIAQAIQAEGMGSRVTDAVSAFAHAASGN